MSYIDLRKDVLKLFEKGCNLLGKEIRAEYIIVINDPLSFKKDPDLYALAVMPNQNLDKVIKKYDPKKIVKVVKVNENILEL